LFATDIGTPREQAALLISLFAAVGMVASPLIGRLCDAFDTRWVFAGMLLLNITAMVSYLVAQSYAGLAIATGIVAISAGGVTPVWSAMIGHFFDFRLYARVMGAMALFTGIAGSLAPVISGWLFDTTGSYRMLFLGLILLVVPSLLCVPLIKRREIPSQSAAACQTVECD
jgi:MFS family permease